MKMTNQFQDQLFATDSAPQDFVFDDRVAAVFDDMVNRSIPGYATILGMIGVIAERYFQPGTDIYDLGCSLGGASIAMAQQLAGQKFTLKAVDNSQAMIRGLHQRLSTEQYDNIQCHCADILDIGVENASVVVLNFTMQFIAPEKRQQLLDRIHAGLRPGGILVVSEKILMPDPELNELLTDLYHNFKQRMGYSELEISRKRTALENVLIPETLQTHRQRFARSGFREADVWFQCFNFASMTIFK